MTLTLLFFASLRERAGCGEARVSPPPSVGSVAALVDWLRAAGDGPARALADLRCVRVAVNGEYATFDRPLRAGDEVAFFPPVTGGR